ncbi:2Fe-2S iron-sulfur cluster-binding protein [Pseudonocardia sp. NPDC046786]|uniref:2Fe-2S iron-sulfur cluster-binding protein n=1 Tax=Pseudonocardia sp. NPDC046786 TaxID=3155471 RepID=UPI0033C51DCA
MPKIIVVDREGTQSVLNAPVGLSLMESLRDEGYDDILALCGGCASCATCHVVVGAAWVDVVGPASEEEVDLLESSPYLEPGRSRLSCQIEVVDEHDGLEIRIAPEE